MPDERSMSPEAIQWLDRAMDNYYRQRIYGILTQVTSDSPLVEVLQHWNNIVEVMCGTSQTLKNELYDAAMIDVKISNVAKNWLRSIR